MSEVCDCESTASEVKKLAARLELLENFVGFPNPKSGVPEEKTNEENAEIEALKLELKNEKRKNKDLKLVNQTLEAEIKAIRNAPEPAPVDSMKELEELKDQLEKYKNTIARLEDIICLKQISEDQDEKTIDELRKQIEESMERKPICDGCDNEFCEALEERTPRILDCGHTLCQECIYEIAGNAETFQCPIDQEDTLLRNRTVESLPLNFAIMKLL